MPRPPKARDPIKAAALALFVEHGINGTGIRDIAKKAGYSEAALYRHWDNKNALIDDLYQEHLHSVVSTLTRCLTSADSFEQRLRDAIHTCYQLYDRNPEVFRFVLLVQHDLVDRLSPDLRMPQDVIQEFVHAYMHATYPQQPHILNHQIAAASIMGTFLQVAQYVIYDRLPSPLTTYSDDVWALCMRMLSPPTDSQETP